jgi:hypothetical protein
MAWDSVPWYVGGGAEHSEELARLLPYLATRGNEGVLHAGDCKVGELAVPGGGVQIEAGVATVLSRAASMQFQAYSGRLLTPDTVDITATGAGAARSDLIVARIEDPWLSGEPWPDPTDETVGPYIFTRVIENVPSTCTSVTELALGYSAIALARVDLPVSTTVVTNAMITDLRTVANPRTERVVQSFYPSAPTDASGATFATWLTLTDVAVPAWATKARIRLNLVRALATTSTLNAQVRVNLGAAATVSDSLDIVAAAAERLDLTLLSEEDVATAIRGTNATLTIDAQRTSGTGVLEADTSTSVFVDIEFVETAE